MLNVATVEPMPDLDPDLGFWSQREVLTHIHTFARSRSVAPFATLGCVMRRAIGCIEPNVMLPPTIGGTVSMNFYTISAGRSGQGKDAANAAGMAAVRFPGMNGEDLDAPIAATGSGEGLARMFKGSKDSDPITRVHQIVPEVKTLEALLGRKGATLEGELLKAYMGQPLGFRNAQKDTTTDIAAHSYRLCLGIGCQPQNADFFLAREKDGFPQRFLWLPTTDPFAPRQRPGGIDPIDVILPAFGTEDYLISLPPSVVNEIVDRHHTVLIGSDDVDPLDGHLTLTRLKVAFALALLDGRKDISEDDWRIGGQLIDISQQVRADMRAVIADKRQRENTARAHDAADRQAILETRLDGERQKRVSQAIIRKLKRSGQATRHKLYQNCTRAIRGDFEPVFDLLLDGGIVVCRPEVEGRADEYELGPEYRTTSVI